MPDFNSEGYFKYADGAARDQLESAFTDDATVHGRAFRDSLAFTVNNYCQMHEGAGELVAEFVTSVPGADERNMDALLALHVLRETQATLNELLESDAEFRASLIGDVRSDDKTDQTIRRDSERWDKEKNVHKEDEIRLSAQEGEATEREISDSAYNGNSEEIERSIHDSHRNKMDGPGSVNIELRSSQQAQEKKLPTESVPATEPVKAEIRPEPPNEKVTIRIPDFTGQPPSVVFRASTRWLGNHLIAVSTGKLDGNSAPRIAPLYGVEHRNFEGEPLGTSEVMVLELVNDIRRKFARLRPPMNERLDDLMDAMRDIDPKNPQGLGDIFRGLIGEMRKEIDDEDDRYGLFSNQDE